MRLRQSPMSKVFPALFRSEIPNDSGILVKQLTWVCRRQDLPKDPWRLGT